MKIIFLDIDGVLNSDTWDKTDTFKNGIYPFKHFDPKAVSLFNKIISETNASVVLSSTWRLKYNIEEMRNIFAKVGIKCNLIDFTPDLKINNNYVVRGNEILKWCKDNKDIIGCRFTDYTDFVIIDDNSDMLLWQSKYFFQTDRLCGLSPTITQNIIRQFS